MTLTNAFNHANPVLIKRIQDNPEALSELRKLDDRLHSIQQKQHTHFLSQRQNWIGKETVKVWEERREQAQLELTPPWTGEMIEPKCLQIARERVHQRIKDRQQQIKDVGKHMKLELVEVHEAHKRAHEKGYAKNQLRINVHNTMIRSNALQKKAGLYFQKNKKLLVKQARKRGIKKPERAVHIRYQERLLSIQRAAHSIVRKTFEEHQQPMPQHFQLKSEQSLKKAFEQEM